MALILSDVPASVAGVFTMNKVKAAPIVLSMRRIKNGISRGIVVNSGNANVSTGKAGFEAALRTASAVEKAAGIKRGGILVASTGVIGVFPRIDKIEAGVPALVKGLSCGGLKDAAEAIMTTDAFTKTALASGIIGGKKITVAGIAKGAGMICPNMATMLSFILTDANIGAGLLNTALKRAVDASFNSIIVDNDTSTNDCVIVFANGAAGGASIKANTKEFAVFSNLINKISLALAHQIVKDGEGATRFVEIGVSGAASLIDARAAARTIAESMLVKTALFGGDPNWGRIMAALGRAGIKMKESRVDISLNGVPAALDGLDTGNEKKAAKAMKKRDVVIGVNLNMGAGSAKVWTTDLGYDYVRINSAYMT